MSFLQGFQKQAYIDESKLTDAERSGLYFTLLNPGYAAQYSYSKAPKGSPEFDTLAKHRASTLSGGAIGSVLGMGAGGIIGNALVLGAYGAKAAAKLDKMPKLFSIPVGIGGFMGLTLGGYYGAKRGHELVAGGK